jgi:hypothetical protein
VRETELSREQLQELIRKKQRSSGILMAALAEECERVVLATKLPQSHRPVATLGARLGDRGAC